MDPLPPPPPSPLACDSAAVADLAREVHSLRRHLETLVRAVTLLAVLLALGLAYEGLSALRRRPLAREAAQLRANLQIIAGAADEYRQASAHSPELIAVGRKYGLEPAAPAAPGHPANLR